MDCCGSNSDVPSTVAVDCPRCGHRGRTVGDETLNALLTAPEQQGSGTWRFCRTRDCPVVYFQGDGTILKADALKVRVGQKEDRADRPICYCFGHSAEDLRARPGLQDEIKAACKRGDDRCPLTNPQGSCCLGNVASVLRSP